MALEYASTCFLPTTWMELPLVEKREVNHDSTLYSFGGQTSGHSHLNLEH